MNVGILGLALYDGFLFINPVTGLMEACIPTSFLRNESLCINGENEAEGALDIIGSRPRQIFTKAVSKEGYMFFGHVGDNTLNYWNHRKPFNTDNIRVVDYDPHRISMVLGIKVITDSKGQEHVGLVSTNMPTFFSKNYIANSTYPVYVLRGKVKDLLTGSGCEIAPYKSCTVF